MTKLELLNSQELTVRESIVIEFLFEALSSYFGEEYTDQGVKEISKGTGIDIKSIKGIVGSLVKKNILSVDDMFDTVYFTDQEELEC